MSVPPWSIRPARKADRGLLARFSCALRATPWEAEVEAYVQNNLMDWAFEPLAKRQDPRLLLVFDRKSKDLVGLVAHERCTLQHADEPPFAATKLEVVAVARAWQGRRFPGGERASDVVMATLMTDVKQRVPRRDARIFAVVHEENLRSLALCRRHGFTTELSRPHPDYRRLMT